MKVKREEFECKCGCGINRVTDEMITIINLARDVADTPFVITSGTRCEKHNKNVGGESESSHMYGLAADIACTDSRSRGMIISALYSVGISRIGIASNFIHFDIDNRKDINVTWLYPVKTRS